MCCGGLGGAGWYPQNPKIDEYIVITDVKLDGDSMTGIVNGEPAEYKWMGSLGHQVSCETIKEPVRVLGGPDGTGHKYYIMSD